jgi:GNAT superfamily N-acetyltransferase
VQTALQYRRTGVGRALMAEAARAARDDFGLQQLHLELRAGLGLEAFYESCGWEQVGRWPGSLALNEHDHRDAVLMFRSLHRRAETS